MPFKNYLGHSTQPAAALLLDNARLEELAIKSEFIKRKTPGFSAGGFLLSALKALASGTSSLSQLSEWMAEHQSKSLSKQAMAYRINQKGKEAKAFVQACLCEILPKLPTPSSSESKSSPVKRILLQDATQLRLHPGNSDHYKGMRNQSRWTSCAKLDTISDLESGELLPTLLSDGKESDRLNGNHLFDYLKSGDLVLRDMGYFDVAAFQRINDQEAFYVSRLTAQVNVLLSDGNSLETLLKSTDNDVLDLKVEVSVKKYKCRLIAIRVPEEVANQRRARSTAHRKKMGSTPRKQSLIRESWTLYLTNLEPESFTPSVIDEVYQQRWAIEIRFRALKGSTHIRELLGRQTNKTHLTILLKVLMIFAHLSGKALKYLSGKIPKDRTLSIEKVSDWLAVKLLSIRKLGDSMRYDLRRLMHEKRSRASQASKLKSLF